MTDSPRAVRRFIAGAICPQCGAQDKIVIDPNTDSRSCVACDFKEARPQDSTDQVEPQTRVSRPSARRVETSAEAVRFVDIQPSK